MIVYLNNSGISDNRDKLTLRCPSCRQLGTLDHLISKAVQEYNNPNEIKFLGQRKCPNNDCNAHIFVVWDKKGNVISSYPPERIDFNASDVPKSIIETFEEAITCHANDAFTASAIMIRRTLEEVCEDQDAKGKNLKKRIESLGEKVLIPPALLSGLDNLRLLGNDAAHIEAKTFDAIGKEEIEIAIEVTKEVLKGVYQMETIVNKLEKLKKGNQQKST